MRRGDIRDRLDSGFYLIILSGSKVSIYPSEKIGNICFVRDGDHNRLPDEEICGPGDGVRYLRAQDLREGEIISNDPIFVTRKYFDSVQRSHIYPGYFLFSIMGSVGNLAVVPEGFPLCTANRAVGILIPKKEGVELSRFLLSLFSTELGARLFETLKKGGLQKRTNLADIESLEIPFPPQGVRRILVAEIESARESRRRKLAAADALLASLDGWLLEQLGLYLPPADNRKVFSLRFGDLQGRFDPQFYLPRYQRILQTIVQMQHVEVGRLVSFSRELWSSEEAAKQGKFVFHYIEISGVDRETGEAWAEEVAVSEAPSRARMLVREGDIIVSLTRPHHGSIAQIDESLDGCIASTGFAVIRSYDKNRITADYLWAILRTQISLQQMLQRSSGGNYPAITEDELAKIRIPLPDLQTQKYITAEVHRRREEARRLRAEAEAEWQAAKKRFEEQLLTGAA